MLDILVAVVGVWAIVFIPAGGKLAKLRRFLLRPAIALTVVFLLSGYAVAANDGWEDRIYQRQQDATFQQIHDFVDVADEAFAYNTHTHHFGDRFREEFPQLLLETRHADGIHYYYSDYILIDYDTHRVGLVYNQHGTLKFFEYQLKPVSASPNSLQQHKLTLSSPGATLLSYCPSRELDQYTDGFALIMADGSVYAITGLCRSRNLYLGLNSVIERIENFSER